MKKDLPAADQEVIQRLKEKGHLLTVAFPSVDLQGDNGLTDVYVCEYENGTEVTFSFADEDRPNVCTDCLYDSLRYRLFGRQADIESILIIDQTIVFPGTYSGKQIWNTAAPAHQHAEIELSTLDKHTCSSATSASGTKDGVTASGDETAAADKDDVVNGTPILWVNTWNHLLGDKNNNTATHPSICYCTGGLVDDCLGKDDKYSIKIGSRMEVDGLYKGLMTSVSKVMTEESAKKLGKRLSPVAK